MPTIRIQRRTPPGQTKVPSEPTSGGVGSELRAIFSWFVVERTRSGRQCQCGKRAKIMDRNGIEWCEANRETIVGWMRKNAAELEVPFFEMAAKAALEAAIWSAKWKRAAG